MNKQEIQETINELHRMKKRLTGAQGCSVNHQEANAYSAKCLRLAISALEHQLTNGWIPVDSLELMRKINNGIAEVCNEHPYKVVGEMDTYSQYNEGWNDACDRIQSKITDILFEQSLPEPYKEDKDAERN